MLDTWIIQTIAYSIFAFLALFGVFTRIRDHSREIKELRTFNKKLRKALLQVNLDIIDEE